MPTLAKVAYRPLGMLASLGAAAAAGRIFTTVWKKASRSDALPGALNADDRLTRVLVAAVLQAAIFALVQALVDRAGAKVYQRVTGTWPE